MHSTLEMLCAYSSLWPQGAGAEMWVPPPPHRFFSASSVLFSEVTKTGLALPPLGVHYITAPLPLPTFSGTYEPDEAEAP